VIYKAANYIGTFISSDPNNFNGIWRDYLRVRVVVPLVNPLKRGMKFRKRDENYYPTIYDTPPENIIKPYVLFMKAPPKRSNFLTASPWLRQANPSAHSQSEEHHREYPGINEQHDTRPHSEDINVGENHQGNIHGITTNYGRDGELTSVLNEPTMVVMENNALFNSDMDLSILESIKRRVSTLAKGGPSIVPNVTMTNINDEVTLVELDGLSKNVEKVFMASKDTDTSARSDTPKAPIPAEAQVPPYFPNNNLLPLNLRLDRSNYTYWRTLVLAAVRAYNLDGFLLGTNPPPPQLTAGNVPNSAYHQWLQLDQFLMHWMMNSITEPMLGYVINCRTSSEIWTVFDQLFAITSRARLLQIRGLLQSTKKGSSTVDDYILKMKGYTDHLAAAGQAINDEDLALYILGGLGSEYESIVVNLTSRSEPLTREELQFMLHDHEVRASAKNYRATTLQNVQANLANLSLNNGNRGGRGYRGAYRGGRDQSTNRGGRGNRPTCQLCGRPEESPGTWYLDTGAINHLTADAQQLTTSADYKGNAKVVVGNGASHFIFSSLIETVDR
uniref:Retrotransposon Copia-like N-terminal domain-containing protein n=1 Tax=Cannabis sativa TaxID=3483 RepID=A0A803QHZ4_CANSA